MGCPKADGRLDLRGSYALTMARSKTSPSRRATRLATTLVLALLTACAGSGLETTTTTVAAITTTSGPGTTVSSTSTSEAGSSTSSTSSTSDEGEIEIEIEDGQPQGGVRTIEVVQGDTVRFEVKSDAAYEIHVHGYDRMYDVEAGGRVQIEFEATIQGIFEIEIEDTSTQIAELVVS